MKNVIAIPYDKKTVIVVCPYCGKQHYHGIAKLPGWRLSHCIDYSKRDNYYIVIKEEKNNEVD